MNKPELLAPAGNAERLKTALHFGADAVYAGVKRMSLRNFADNFTLEELKEMCGYAHSIQKRVYVTCNAFAKDEDLEGLGELLSDIRSAGADALIVSDPGVIVLARETVPDIDMHLSTQANTLNSKTVQFWFDQGIKRIILARELSLAQIKRIRDSVPAEIELEMFVHGAMCISYSGRCLLSNFMTGRESNRGECAQPCRWSYEVRESGKDESYPVMEDEHGTYIFNSRDLMLIEYLDEILKSGICSLKIEGRMKTVYYVATVVNAYRMALDAYFEAAGKKERYCLDPLILQELYKASHRPFTTGFAFGNPGAAGQSTDQPGMIQPYEFVALVKSYDRNTHTAELEQRNKFFSGDVLEVLSPGKTEGALTVQWIKNEAGEAQLCAPHPQQKLIIGCDKELKPGDLLRKKL